MFDLAPIQVIGDPFVDNFATLFQMVFIGVAFHQVMSLLPFKLVCIHIVESTPYVVNSR